MSKQDIADFCNTYNACSDGRDWALDNCDSMHDVWLTARLDWLGWVATRPGVLSERDLRLFACWCARQVWHLLTDERSKNAIVVAEKYAVGEATTDELDLAWAAPEWSAAACAAATWAAKAAAEADAVWAAAVWAAAAQKVAQAEYLRERFNPFLKEGTK